jgi:hypothetical protein
MKLDFRNKLSLIRVFKASGLVIADYMADPQPLIIEHASAATGFKGDQYAASQGITLQQADQLIQSMREVGGLTEEDVKRVLKGRARIMRKTQEVQQFVAA